MFSMVSQAVQFLAWRAWKWHECLVLIVYQAKTKQLGYRLLGFWRRQWTDNSARSHKKPLISSHPFCPGLCFLLFRFSCLFNLLFFSWWRIERWEIFSFQIKWVWNQSLRADVSYIKATFLESALFLSDMSWALLLKSTALTVSFCDPQNKISICSVLSQFFILSLSFCCWLLLSFFSSFLSFLSCLVHQDGFTTSKP